MIDISLLALTRAWFATVVALAVLLLASFAIEQDWNSAVYLRGLPQALELMGDEGPPPIIDQSTIEELATGACTGETKPSHCESCRKHSGPPVSVFVAYERTAYTVTKGEIAKFESTPGKTERGFCAGVDQR